jgi:hypothetical protein
MGVFQARRLEAETIRGGVKEEEIPIYYLVDLILLL